MWQSIIAGFSLGLLSSFHCIGMCGPLALSLPLQNKTAAGKAIAVLLYQLGRILTYSTLGLLVGLAGRPVHTAGLQQELSIIAGGTILLLTILNSFSPRSPRLALPGKYRHYLQQWIARLWKNAAGTGFLLLGIANGLLPCGMVWLALAASLAAATVGNSVLFMVCFGAGTLPVMAALSWFGSFISLPFRNRIRSSTPYLVIFMATLLILRGLNLGIPFISPVAAPPAANPVSCH